jgi:Ino eighty subunit 2
MRQVRGAATGRSASELADEREFAEQLEKDIVGGEEMEEDEDEDEDEEEEEADMEEYDDAEDEEDVDEDEDEELLAAMDMYDGGKGGEEEDSATSTASATPTASSTLSSGSTRRSAKTLVKISKTSTKFKITLKVPAANIPDVRANNVPPRGGKKITFKTQKIPKLPKTTKTAKAIKKKELSTGPSKRGRPRKKTDEDSDEEIELEDDSDDVIGLDDVDDDSDDDELIYRSENEDDEGNIDLSKLSDRQRAKYLGTSEDPEDLRPEFYTGKKLPKSVLALMEGNKKKKVMTAEEIEMRKAEAARKRKTFNQRKLEAEKKETLKKLLHRKIDKVDARKQEQEEERRKQNKLKRKEIIKHKALFSWVSRTEVGGETDTENKKRTVSYYSMQ